MSAFIIIPSDSKLVKNTTCLCVCVGGMGVGVGVGVYRRLTSEGLFQLFSILYIEARSPT